MMNSEQEIQDAALLQDDRNRTPSQFLKVLTVLTMIASVWVVYQAVMFSFSGNESLLSMEERIAKLEEQEISGMMLNWAQRGLDMLRMRFANQWLFLISDVVGAALCFWGALMMRKLHKTGYFAWLAGEFLPILIGFLIAGSDLFHPLMLTGLILPLAFAFMYYSQFRYMS